MLTDPDESTQNIIIVALLLCLFGLLTINETTSCLLDLGSESAFVKGLETWADSCQDLTIFTPIAAWLRLLHVAGKRGGNPGMLSEHVLEVLPCEFDIPPLSLLDGTVDLAASMMEHLSTPIFTFYLKLQELPSKVANLGRYHRSRTALQDQDEVSEKLAIIRAQLGRYPLAQSIQDHDTLTIQHPHSLLPSNLVTYHRPDRSIHCLFSRRDCRNWTYAQRLPFATLESKQSMQVIRDITDGAREAYNTSTDTDTSTDANANADLNPNKNNRTLNAGYTRPLLLDAIETVHIQTTNGPSTVSGRSKTQSAPVPSSPHSPRS